jgi:hypothetical protein
MWSLPSKEKKFNDNIKNNFLIKNFYLYLFSTLLIKKLGYDIELYCDKETAEIFSLIPYDKINIIDFNNDGISGDFWIWGKLKTQMLMNEPYIHIDGDVFLFRDIIKDQLDNNYKSVVQMIENDKTIGKSFKTVYSYQGEIFKKKNIGNIKWNKYNLQAYNCGVIGFSDMNLKNKYIDKAYNILKDIQNNEDIKINCRYDGILMIIEQSLLYYILTENNIKPLEILPKNIIENKKNWLSLANEIGYCHMWSYRKYDDDIQNQIKFKINKFFPKYKNILTKINIKYKNKTW